MGIDNLTLTKSGIGWKDGKGDGIVMVKEDGGEPVLQVVVTTVSGGVGIFISLENGRRPVRVNVNDAEVWNDWTVWSRDGDLRAGA